MIKTEWFRKEIWTEGDKEEFLTRLSRSRTPFHREQYLRIQALHLFRSGKKAMVIEAKKLLEKAIEEYPDNISIALSYKILAECNEFLGDFDSAVKHYRTSIQCEIKKPTMKSGANLSFARFVVEHEMSGLYDEILNNLEHIEKNQLIFPAARYDYFLSLALIYMKKNELEKAKSFAQLAIIESKMTSSGFSRHKTIGLVKHDHFIEKLEEIIKK